MRIAKACNRCGNVYPEWEKMTLFIDGLDPVIRTLVARYREETPRAELSFERLVHYAQDDGDAHRARGRSQRPLTTATASLPTSARKPVSKARDGASALMAESSVEFRHGSLDNDHESTVGGLGELHLLQDDTTDSIPTGDLPSTTVYDDESIDPTLVMGRPGHYPAPLLAFQEYFPQVARGRPGWEGLGGPPAKHPRIICYMCYGLGHMASNCLVSLRDTHTVVRNFDALSEEDKSHQPVDTLQMARDTLARQ